MVSKLRLTARRMRQETMTVYFAARDPRTPLPVKLLALATAGYALSPIDLIPDFVPVLGYLDDLILLPLGILLVLRFTPAEVVEASRARAKETSGRPTSAWAAGVVVAVWLFCVGVFGYWLLVA